MYVDYSQQQHIATWNPARGVWETNQMNLLCEHSVLYSETWPASGMTLNGQAYELPMPVQPTTVSEYSSLPTPTTQDNSGKCRDHGGDLLHELTCGCSRAERRLPTPTVSDQYTANLTSSQQTAGSLHSVTLAQIVNRPDLLPTPMTTDYKQTDCEGNWNRHSPPLGTIVHGPWGRFEPAIKRWEQTINRPAPTPTQPDGKDGQHRLSAHFTEWLMGLPNGWITNAGLTRNEQLKACGNGVVPQQAKLALEILDVKL